MSVRMIGLAGPSGSGKSTIARRAERELGSTIELVKLDKFYKDATQFPKLGTWRNWEVSEDILWDELYHVLTELKAGRAVEVPLYSKLEGRRTGKRVAEPANLILVEGFLLFYEQRIRDLFELKIY
jgi:uridine kinase